MKILFFIETLRAGGKERRLIELLKVFAQYPDMECKVVITQDSRHYADQLPANVELMVLERAVGKKDISVFFKFYRLCSHFSPDVIHVWGNMPAFYSVPTSLMRHIPIVNSQITDSFGIDIRQFFSYLTHKINFYFSAVILSNSLSGIRSYKISGNKFEIINNGLSLERFHIAKDLKLLKRELGLKTQYSVIMVGSFSECKNFDLFIDVARHFQDIRSDVTFIAVGDGINHARIKERISNEGIKNTLLTGTVKNVEELVAISDIGILLSPLGEGMSNAILEYMTLGKPVIASDKGGNNELIANGINGYLLLDESVEQIASHINTMLSNADLYIGMSNNNRSKVAQNFDIQKIAPLYANIYQRLCK